MKLSTKAIIKITVTALFLLLCILAPSWFVSFEIAVAPPDDTVSPSPTIALTPLEGGFPARAALFNDKFDSNNNSVDGISLGHDEIDEKTIEACYERRNSILAELTVDMSDAYSVPTDDTSYHYVSDGDGGYIRLMRFFKEWYGDWKNWIVIVIDVDTQDLYYLYISSSCLQNHEKYRVVPTPDSLMDFMAGYTGYKPILAGNTTDGVDTTFHCIFGANEGYDYAYDITGHHYYDDNEPSRLFDYTILCKFDTYLIQSSVEYDANN